MKKKKKYDLIKFTKELQKFCIKWKISGLIMAGEGFGTICNGDKGTRLELIQAAKLEQRYIEKCGEIKVDEWIQNGEYNEYGKIKKKEKEKMNYLG